MDRSRKLMTDKNDGGGADRGEPIQSNFFDLTMFNGPDNPLMKQLNRIQALKDIHKDEKRSSWTKSAEDLLLKREENKIKKILQKENLGIEELNQRLEAQNKRRVGFDLPPKTSLHLAEAGDYVVTEKSNENKNEDVDNDVSSDSDREILSRHVVGSGFQKRCGYFNPKDFPTSPPPNSKPNWIPLSPNTLKIYENTNLWPRIQELHPNLNNPESKSSHAENHDENLAENHSENHDVNISENHNENHAANHTKNLVASHTENLVASHTENLVASHTENLVASHTENFASSHSENSVSSHGKNSVASHGENSVASHGENSVASHGENFVASHNENRAANHSKNHAEYHVENLIKSDADNRSIGVTETVSLSSFTDSDCEQDPELHLFELMETISANPSFTEFSELAKKFVSREHVLQDLTDQLRTLNRELVEEKRKLEIINENLMKDKLSLLKSIEDLLLDKDEWNQQMKILQRKATLDVRHEKEVNVKAKRRWLREKEVLVIDQNDLIQENKTLVAENISLKQENRRLEKDRLQLLTEKECWVSEKNVILVGTRDLALKNKQLVKDKETLMAEKRSLMNSSNQSATAALKVNETRLPNGDLEVNLDNGTTKYVTKEGRDYKYIYLNGDVKELKPDGSVNYFYRESNIMHVTKPDGIIVMTFPNGQVETVQPDGTKTVLYTNGIVRKILPTGLETYTYPDKTTVVTDGDGIKCFTFPNGQQEYHYPEFTKRVFPDGTVKTLFQDNSSETKWANGRIRAKDAAGNLIYDTGDPPVPEYLREIRKYNLTHKKV